MVGRRNFLGGLAGVLASAGSSKTLKDAGVAESSLGLEAPYRPTIADSLNVESSTKGSLPWWVRAKARLKLLESMRPAWYEKKRRKDAYYVNRLDPDIAALRSVSASAKINMQRERQYNKYVLDEKEGYDMRMWEDEFDKMMGES